MDYKEKFSGVVPKSFALKAFILGWGMVILFVIFNSLGSLMLKAQIQKVGAWNFSTVRSYFAYFATLFSQFQTWLGLGSICVAMGAWMLALGHLELSKAYPVAIGLNLLIVVGLGMLYFDEPLTLSKIMGAFLILSGVIVLFR